MLKNKIVSYLTLLFLLFLFTPSLSQAQSDLDSVVITRVNIENFPQVKVVFRALDSNNNIVTNLTANDITVYENENRIVDFEVDTQDRAPITVVFMIDQGRYFNYQGLGADVIKDGMTHLANSSYFRDGYDRVAIITRRNQDGDQVSETILPATQSTSEFVNAVNDLSFDNAERTDGLGGVEDGLGQISQLGDAGEGSTAVIYVGSIIDHAASQSDAVSDARSLAALAKEQKTKIHVLHTNLNGEFADPLQALTRGSGGEYVRLYNDRNNDISLDRLYQDLVDQAQTNQLTYQSQSSVSGSRNVVIVPVGVPLEAASGAGKSYSIEVETPKVAISLPSTEIDRRPERDSSGDTWAYQVDTVELEVTVAWQTNPPRDIVAADLVVDGIEQFTVQPNVANNRFQLTWDLTDIERETRTLPVQVRVRDALGVEAISPARQVTVNASIPEGVARETAVPPPAPAPTVNPCTENPGSAACVEQSVQRIAPWTTIMLTIVVIGLAVMLILNRNKVGQVASAAGETVRKGVAEVQKTLVGGGKRRGRQVLAKLHINIARRALMGEEVNIYANTTKLGRNPKLCDVQLIDEDDISTVSGLHCTIQYDPGRGVFLITDDNSANGTFVNNHPLPPNDPRVLQDGDEIILGEIARRGAKVTFHAADNTGVPTEIGSEQSTSSTGNKTIVDDPHSPADPSATLHDTDFDAPFDSPYPDQDTPYTKKEDDIDDSWLDEL
jgi:hypothetical protein